MLVVVVLMVKGWGSDRATEKLQVLVEILVGL